MNKRTLPRPSIRRAANAAAQRNGLEAPFSPVRAPRPRRVYRPNTTVSLVPCATDPGASNFFVPGTGLVIARSSTDADLAAHGEWLRSMEQSARFIAVQMKLIQTWRDSAAVEERECVAVANNETRKRRALFPASDRRQIDAGENVTNR
jgi:hypothetical protein